MSTAERSPGTVSASPRSEVPQQAAPPPVVRGEPAEVADGVLVIPDGRVPLVPNVGFVVGDQAVLVIDTGVGRRNGAYVLEHARRLAGGRPVFLTATHFHPEHGFGAQVFKGEATIIYNRPQRDELHRKGAAYIEMFKGLGPDIAAEIADVELTDPDVTYDGQAEIDLGGHRAVLRSWGPAHTAGDQTILVDGRVLFGGDLFETRMFPIVPYFPPADTDVDGSRWITVLDQLIALDPAVVVPGHGEITDVSLIRDVRDYLGYVRGEASRLRASGASADETAAAIEQDARARWDTWANPEWIGYAARAFHQASAPAARAEYQGGGSRLLPCAPPRRPAAQEFRAAGAAVVGLMAVIEGSPVEIFQFDREERIVESYGSRGLRATRIAAGTGQVGLTCLVVAPGGVIGTHPAADAQLFLVIAGQGWTAGPDGERVPISAGWGVRWDAGEIHTSGTEAGLVALSVEGGPLDLFEPESREPS